MKLSRAKDLAPIRADACAQIDAAAERAALAVSAVPTIHAVKARMARGGSAFPDAAAIAARADAADAAILAIDEARLARKRAVAAATSEQTIRAVLAQL